MRIKQFEEEIIGYRQELHKYPELEYQEFRTQRFIADTLTAHGIKCNTEIYKTAVVADIVGANGSAVDNGTVDTKGKKCNGQMVALRADMDALAMTESVDANPRSLNAGVMHSCGHDVHMASLLGAAIWLSKNKDKFTGTVRIVFQPAEEDGMEGGAKGLIEAGVMKGVSAIFGLHVWTGMAHGTVGICEGKAMASSDDFRLTITGKGGHIAKPTEGNNTIYPAAEFASNLNWVQSQRTKADDEVVIGLAYLRAGTTANNVIPQVAELGGSIRCFNESTRVKIKEEMTLLAKTIAEKYGVKCDYSHTHGYGPTINDLQAAEFYRKSCAKVEGVNTVTIPSSVMGAEDIGAYFKHAKGAMAWIGATKDEKSSYNIHHPSFFCHDETVLLCAEIYLQVALDFLEKGEWE